MATDVDEQTAAYILEHHRYFEDLKQIATQLAGLLVLSASGARTASPDHPMLESATKLFDDAADGIRRAHPPARALRQHSHLKQAVEAIGKTLVAARQGLAAKHPEIEPILARLQVGYGHLQQAADCLPGFEMVAFDRGCCGLSKLSTAEDLKDAEETIREESSSQLPIVNRRS
jgi:hypothetical protein